MEQLIGVFTDPSPGHPAHGWYREGRSRFGWDWLAKRFDIDHDGTINRKEFDSGKRREGWPALDRDRNGTLTADDFDWSESSKWQTDLRSATDRFFEMDSDTDGRISPAEWQDFYATVSREKDYISVDDLHAFLALRPRKRPRAFSFRYRWYRAVVILNGDIGSMFEGPRVGDTAPDFTLETVGGGEFHSLSDRAERSRSS